MGWANRTVVLSLMFCWALMSLTNCDNIKESKCDIEVSIDGTYTLSIPEHSNGSYTPGTTYTWCVQGPPNTTVALLCNELDIPKSPDCEINALVVSSDEDKSRSYCGTKMFQTSSSSNKMTIKLRSSKKSRAGYISCRVRVEEEETYSLRAIVYDNCDCGYSYRVSHRLTVSKTRIVGGEETGINEFPFMAGLVDNRRGAVIVCGATIISPQYVLTADHCLESLELAQTAVVIGEHNVSTGAETTVTRLIRARRFIPYPYYNNRTRQYDIALIELMSPITYSARVGPACLPFISRNYDLTGQVVTILGWGTTDFGGPRSRVLRKVDVDLINISNCQNSYGSDIEPYTQLCAYRANRDACQFDSGGPLIWLNPSISRYEVVGLVSYGRACASQTPSVNTRVAPFLQWILDNTQSETYCSKTS